MWFLWPENSVVRVVASDIFAGDAIGNFNLQIRSFLETLNIPCRLYAANFDETQDTGISHFDAFFTEYTRNDVLLCNYSIYEQRNERLADCRLPKAVYYHGITPPEYFAAYDEATARNCARGIDQHRCFSEFDFFLSNSRYMLEQLLGWLSVGSAESRLAYRENSAVCPPFINAAQWDSGGMAAIEYPEGAHSLLYVGRVVPHKCVHELFDLLEVLVDKGADPALRIVGSCGAPAYCEELEALLDGRFSHLKRRVAVYGHVSQVVLKSLYESSDVFVTMSEHEGFCVPLVEAMQFGLPVVAKGGGAIPETLSESGMVFYRNDYDAISSHILSLFNGDVRQRFIGKQNEVYTRILDASDGRILLGVLEKLVRKSLQDA